MTRKLADRGASAVEYGLLIVGVALAVAVIVTALGLTVQGAFQKGCQAVAQSPSGQSCTEGTPP